MATHACRHLALLAFSDPGIAATAAAQPGLWNLLGKLTPASAGSIHLVSLAK